MSLTHRTARGALIGLLVLLGTGPLFAQGKFKWWQSDRYKTELMLTADQSKRLEEIFQNALPTLRAQMKALSQSTPVQFGVLSDWCSGATTAPSWRKWPASRRRAPSSTPRAR